VDVTLLCMETPTSRNRDIDTVRRFNRETSLPGPIDGPLSGSCSETQKSKAQALECQLHGMENNPFLARVPDCDSWDHEQTA
jgi:hypothetical protein